jgi:hypothetical protein
MSNVAACLRRIKSIFKIAVLDQAVLTLRAFLSISLNLDFCGYGIEYVPDYLRKTHKGDRNGFNRK